MHGSVGDLRERKTSKENYGYRFSETKEHSKHDSVAFPESETFTMLLKICEIFCSNIWVYKDSGRAVLSQRKMPYSTACADIFFQKV